MNPYLILLHALKHLQWSTPPGFRTTGRQDAMTVISSKLIMLEHEHGLAVDEFWQ